MTRTTGTYHRVTTAGEEVSAFVPDSLPPSDPALWLSPAMDNLLDRAQNALARLELAGDMVPSAEWFVYAFMRKEAVISSQLEGTQATLVDLFAIDADADALSAREADVHEVTNYLAALDYARTELRAPDGLPLSMRLLNESHRLLMRGVRGQDKQPGEVRRSQNWIGGTRPGNAHFVPPPPQLLADLLGQLEQYIHAIDDLPPLVRAGLLHAQFETIHPYLDGNGRIGRLLIALLLEQYGLLSEQLLYVSLFFKRHRDEYYRRLGAVRTEGDWEGWIDFFLEGVRTVADEAVNTARDLFALVTRDRAMALAHSSSTVAALRLFELLPTRPIVTIRRVTQLLGTTKPTATKAVSALVSAGVLSETTGRKRDRAFTYEAYLDRLKEGTELEG